MKNETGHIGVLSATTLVAASMIGVGVYTTSGFTLAALQTPERVIMAWVVGGIIAICGAIGYASLASRFTESGGEYLFLSRTLHPVAGVMAGWVSMLAGFTGAIAVAALGLEEYLVPMLGEGVASLPGGTIAIASVVLAAIMHAIGVRGASQIQDAVVIVKLILIAVFVVFAARLILPNSDGLSADGLSAGPLSDTAAPMHWLDFAGQLVWISFSYAGFNAAVYIAGEVRSPNRNVPRALVGGTVLVTVVYVLLNAIFVHSAPIGVITAGENISQVAATAATSLGGQRFALLVRGVIVISLLTSVSAMVMTGPRVYAKMADDGFLPSFLRFTGRVPVAAIAFQAVLAIIVISVSTLTQLLGYLGLTLSVSSALTVAMLLVLRFRGEIERLPLYGIPPVIYVIATLGIAVMYAISKPEQAIAAAATLVIGGMFFVTKRKAKKVTTNS
ncbi:APC family permease [Rubripirellula reticaptiva]|uniref:Serine/threonine exchanger SteT n=1 Tax=Rubripirellula reticaptiva TaxID=2528013 RepID=A0A5C6FBN5_9BACT|nr:amino acid permease [Rubripirellula reticaptiva]TWU58202.1 Serine/threonine exchanger SteT [Rubripirellula reticaptiva]